MMIAFLLCVCGVLAGLLIGLWGMSTEQADSIRWLHRQLDLERDENRALTEAVGRAGKVAVQYPREERKQKLKPSEGYWDRRGEPMPIDEDGVILRK